MGQMLMSRKLAFSAYAIMISIGFAYAVISNVPPIIESLAPELESPQEVGATVTWSAKAVDSEGDPISYKFLVKGPRTDGKWEVVQDWSKSDAWTWITDDRDVGSSDMSVWVRDGEHTGEMDDFKNYTKYKIASGQLDSGERLQFKDKEYMMPIICSGCEVMDTNRGLFTPEAFDIGCPTNSSGDDLWLSKTDSDGKKIWTKVFGGACSDRVRAYQETTDGGYIFAGSKSSCVEADSGIWLLKIDSDGNRVWERTFRGSGTGAANDMKQTKDGGYILACYFYWPPPTDNMLLIKTDSTGNKIWEKNYDKFQPHSILQTEDDGFIIAGQTVTNPVLIRTDSNGNLKWNKTLGSSMDIYHNDIWSIQHTRDAGFIITGSVSTLSPATVDGEMASISISGYSGERAWLAKIDAAGNILWNQIYGNGTGRSVQQTKDEGYIIVGETYFPASSSVPGGYRRFLIKTDSMGNELWEKEICPCCVGAELVSVQQIAEGSYIVTNSYNGLAKTDLDGNLLWSKGYSFGDYLIKNQA